MADSRQEIHIHSVGSMQMPEGNSKDDERAQSPSVIANGQPPDRNELPTNDLSEDNNYLRRICMAIEQVALSHKKAGEYKSDDPTAVVGVIRHRWGESQEVQGIAINSELLGRILQDVAGFYPGANLNATPLIIKKPFSLLFHTLPALIERSQLKRDDDNGWEELHDKLLPSCDKYLSSIFESFRGDFAAGKVSFPALGALFRPGSLLIAVDSLNQQQLFMCLGGRYQSKYSTDTDDIMLRTDTKFLTATWALYWNPPTRSFNRKILEFHFPFFEGSRNIKGLPIYPFDIYVDEEGRKLIRKELIARGRRWGKLVSAKPSCWMHEGLYARPGKFGQQIIRRGRLIVDSVEELPLGTTFSSKTEESPNVKFWDNRSEYIYYDNVASENLTDEQALFCPSSIRCLDPQDLKSAVVAVTDLNPVQWNKSAFDQLVLDDNRKTIIRSLVENHSKEFSDGTKDIIEGKGAGLVIVLYGPPGVGKTLTAESVAECTGKPLIALRVSNLLTEEEAFSDSISKFLDDADRLEAILLIDEADVILESRSFEDIKRNGMVSAFLRTLEYFNGIIFMTTNRLGTMDHAFHSRIQYATEYTLSTLTRRKIWKLFIERLDSPDSREELLDDIDYLKKLELNGRQIRNAMKLAQSLALQECRELCGEKLRSPAMPPLKVRHVRQAAKEMQGLQQYFNRKKATSQEEIGADLTEYSASHRKFEVKIRGQGQTAIRDQSEEDE